MDCTGARPHLIELARGGDVPADVRAHAATCAACATILDVERALDRTLATLPTARAPAALRATLEAMAPRPARARSRAPTIAIAAAAAVVMALAILVVIVRPRGALDPLEREAVNDHLRLVYSEHPLDVAASDMHAVRPWFTGRLDFAPVLGFAGDDTFTLAGGTVGVFVDRKCAVIAWHKRLHTITLIVVPAAGLDFPAEPRAGRDRGFATLLWRRGDLGYALISDVEPADLAALQARLAP